MRKMHGEKSLARAAFIFLLAGTTDHEPNKTNSFLGTEDAVRAAFFLMEFLYLHEDDFCALM